MNCKCYCALENIGPLKDEVNKLGYYYIMRNFLIYTG